MRRWFRQVTAFQHGGRSEPKLAAMFAGRRRVITGPANRLTAAIVPFVPRGVVLRLAKMALR